MNKEETKELIQERINFPRHCIFCGGLLEDCGKTGYHMDRCTKCGAVHSEG